MKLRVKEIAISNINMGYCLVLNNLKGKYILNLFEITKYKYIFV